MHDLTLLPSLLGGLLIGASACLLLLTNGRIAGISGIVSGIVIPKPGEAGWRIWFVAGLLAGGLVASRFVPDAFAETPPVPMAVVAVAGLLVGFGTRLGNGCTSGHGVCGLARLSPRSLVATLTFMAAGAITVLVSRHLIGGAR